MQYVVGIAPVSNIDAIRKYYCIGLMVINSDAICDFITSVQDWFNVVYYHYWAASALAHENVGWVRNPLTIGPASAGGGTVVASGDADQAEARAAHNHKKFPVRRYEKRGTWDVDR
jgi:hypothetical protein